jgi:hypothetical protein
MLTSEILICGLECGSLGGYNGVACELNADLFHCILEEDCYNCMASLIGAKDKMFTQTKQLYEVTWRTVMQITKKHVVNV